MHGEKIHEDRGIDRRYPSQKGRGGDKSCDWRELWSEPEAGKGAHQPSKSVPMAITSSPAVCSICRA